MRSYQPKKLSKVYSIPIRLTIEEKALLEEKVFKYAGGLTSVWLRYAGINHIPRRSDADRIEVQREFMIRAKIDYDKSGVGLNPETMAEIVINPRPTVPNTFEVCFIDSDSNARTIVVTKGEDEDDVFILLRNALNQYIEDDSDEQD